MALIIYDSTHSVYARRARLLAAELGLPLERRTLDFGAGEFSAPDYVSKNPTARVPTLDDDGFIVWESIPITKYLATKTPERGMSPDDPKQQALIDQWLFWYASHLGGAITVLAQELLVKLAQGNPGRDPGLLEAARGQIARALPVIEQQLAGKLYIMGDLGVADFVFAPQLEALPVVEIDTAPYPSLCAWIARMQSKPYWKTA